MLRAPAARTVQGLDLSSVRAERSTLFAACVGPTVGPEREDGVPLRLDQATSLTHVGDTLYIGFNEDLERISFPALETVGGALIIEANGTLTDISFPKLLRVQKYLHIHDHAGLRTLELPRLRSVGGELSIRVAPNLGTVRVATAAAPAEVSRVEVEACAQPVYPGLHVRLTSARER